MKFLIIGLKKHYHIKRLQEEAEKLGDYTVEGILPKQLVIKMSMSREKYVLRGYKGKFKDIDLIYTWVISPKRKWDWFLFLRYLYNKYNTQIIYNKYVDPNYQVFLTPAEDYKKQVHKNIPFPKSVIFFSDKSIKSALRSIEFPAVLKVNAPKMSKQGKGVHLVKSEDEIKTIVDEYKDVAERFILREFIPNNGDIRVFIVGYKAVAAMHRIPKDGDFRSNISQGGSAEPFDLNKNPHVKKLAEEVAKLMRTEIAGVDIMINKYSGKPYVLEVNGGPQFQGLETLTGVNIAKELVKYFINTAKNRKRKVFNW